MRNACRIVRFLAAVPWLATTAPVAWTQGAYPTKPVRMIAPYPPGGTTDVVCRIMAQKLTEADVTPE